MVTIGDIAFGDGANLPDDAGERIVEIHRMVLTSWPRSVEWPDAVWDRWWEELARFEPDEVIDALRKIARRGSPWPPVWGEVYAAAWPKARERLAWAAQAAQLAADRAETGDAG